MKQLVQFKRIFAVVLLLTVSTISWANGTEINGIYYVLKSSTKTASVTYTGTTSSYNPSSTAYTGSITIPSTVTYNSTTYSVTSIGDNAFYDCSGLTSITIPNSVTSIGRYAFSDCSGLTSVTIGNSVTSIGNAAFLGCSGLTKAEFASIESLCKIKFGDNPSNPLYYAKHLYINGQEVTDVVIPNSVKSIESRAFYNCSSLTSVTIPNSVTSIGQYAFSDCSGLTSVTIPNSVTSIGARAFSECSGLTSVTIPESVTSIGYYAFYNCSGLTSVTINANDIVSKTYSSGSNLGTIFGTQVKEYVLGDDVKGIGESAFEGCSGLTSITIPNSVTSIGESAFYNCSGLTSVTIPNSVTSIGNHAFRNCSGLTSVTIGNSVTSIGFRAFYRCSGLTSIIIPNSVTSIGDYAFELCSDLTSVTIGNSVTSIGDNAFYDCSGLTSVTLNANDIVSKTYSSSSNLGTIFGTQVKEYVLGDDVKGIGNYAFYNCSGLTSVTIPNSVTSIGNSAFYGCTGLTSVTIPNSVTNIGEYVFYDCSGLTSVTIPSSVTSIGRYAFYGCSGLTSITIPNSVTSIGDNAFERCSSLTSVTLNANDIVSKTYSSSSNLGTIFGTQVKEYVLGDDVKGIGGSAFSGCTGLTSVTIPNSVTSIGNYAFSGCSGLTSVTLNANDIVSKTYSNSNLGTIFGSQVKEYVLGDDVKGIGNYAFYKCTSLTSIIIPNSVTSIGNSAFYGCTGLTSVTIPNSVTSISTQTFYNCTSLTSVTIPNSVTSISGSAFSGTAWYNNQPDGLLYAGMIAYKYKGTMATGTKITLEEGTLGIGESAFEGCSGLTSITIPNSVTSIGNSAFYGCTGLTKAEFASIESLFKIIFGDDSSNPLYYAKHLYINGQEVTDVVIPNSVTSIGSYAFRGCSGLTSVTIPSSVTSIGNYAFFQCSGLTSITIPNSVTSIGRYAFYGCSGLTSITIPNSVTSIGDNAFERCSSLTSVTLNANDIVSKTYSSSSNLGTIFGTQVREYVLGDDVKGIGNQAFYKCSGLTSITIPNSVTSIGNQAFYGCSGLTSVTLNAKYIVSKTYSSSSNLGTIFGTQVKEYVLGDDVKGIGDWAFSGCIGLTSVTIGNSVKSIGSSAFSGCRGLTSITIGSSVTSIGDNAFERCIGLTSVTIGNSVKSIGDYAFSGCSGLTSVTIGNSVTSIGSYAFTGCSGLTSVTIGNSVTSIGLYAFYNCSGLTSVTIPNSVTSIGNSAFYGCTGLTSVTIPNSVTSIEYHAFRNCSGLTSVTIPNSVTSIRDYAFSGCSRLTSVTIGNSVTSIGNYAFNGCSRLEEVILNSNSIVSQTYTSTGNISTIFGSQVKKYILGDNITGIGEYAFPSNTSIYVSAKSSLLAAWNYGISPYDLKTSVLLANPLPTVQTNTASSIHVSRNSSAEESGIIISSESITVAGVTITKIGHTTKFTGLTPNTEYTVAYNSTIKYAGSTFSYSNEYRATTNALTLTTSQPKVISVGNVVVGAISNLDDAEENVGFEWRRTDWTDDFASNTGAAYLYEGTMEGYIRNLYTEKLWKVRPYYKSNDGKLYYGEWVGLDPTNTSYFEPTVHTYARIDQTENKVQISGYVQRGTDDVRKQGFKYWEQEDNARGAGISIPSGAKTVEADGRVMEVELTGLKPNTTYAYVAFVTTTEGETFYGKQLSFTTGDDPEASVTGDANGNGVVEIGDVTSVLTLMATPEATGYNNKAADANGNGVIEIGDVTTILTIMANGE